MIISTQYDDTLRHYLSLQALNAIKSISQQKKVSQQKKLALGKSGKKTRYFWTCKLTDSAGVEYTNFEYEYATFKSIEYEYLVLELSTSTQSPSTSSRVLFSIFLNNKHSLNQL